MLPKEILSVMPDVGVCNMYRSIQAMCCTSCTGRTWISSRSWTTQSPLELDKSLRFSAKATFEGEKESEEMYRALNALHPRAVEKQDEHTIIVRHLF